MHRRNRVFRRIGEGGKRARSKGGKDGRKGGGKWKGREKEARGGGKVCDPSDGWISVAEHKQRIDSILLQLQKFPAFLVFQTD